MSEEVHPSSETPCEQAERQVYCGEELLVEQEARVSELRWCDYFNRLPEELIMLRQMRRLQALALAGLTEERVKRVITMPLPAPREGK